MKIKVTVYTLASDTRDGTDCEVFGSEAELNAALVLIMEEKLDRGYDHTDEINEHIKAGEIDEAWALFEDYIRNPEDTYSLGEHEIEAESELPQVDILVSGLVSIRAMARGRKRVNMLDGTSLDSFCGLVLDRYKETLSPAPTVSA